MIALFFIIAASANGSMIAPVVSVQVSFQDLTAFGKDQVQWDDVVPELIKQLRRDGVVVSNVAGESGLALIGLYTTDLYVTLEKARSSNAHIVSMRAVELARLERDNSRRGSVTVWLGHDAILSRTRSVVLAAVIKLSQQFASEAKRRPYSDLGTTAIEKCPASALPEELVDFDLQGFTVTTWALVNPQGRVEWVDVEPSISPGPSRLTEDQMLRVFKVLSPVADSMVRGATFRSGPQRWEIAHVEFNSNGVPKCF